MSWFADLAGKAENLLTNIDEQTGAVLRNQNALTKQRKLGHVECDPPQIKKKRPIPRSLKTVTTKNSPPPNVLRKTQQRNLSTKVPVIKIPSTKCKMNECPRTETEDPDCYGYKPRRYSLPGDLGDIPYQDWVSSMGKLETVNSKLVNELNLTNKEIKELINRLHTAEEELNKKNQQLENFVLQNQRVNGEKKSLLDHIERLEKEIVSLSNEGLSKHQDEKRELSTEIAVLRDQNRDMEELIKLYAKQDKESAAIQKKTEAELRHAQSVINLLQNEKTKNNNECIRLEKEWEAYKVRVKSMLASKDKEIQALQQGVNLTEDTKLLVEQIEQLKQERESLSEVVSRLRGEYEDMKNYVRSLENEHSSTEMVVNALREALKEERNARTRAEAACKDITGNLKSVQIETGQTIASLRAALMEKESVFMIQDAATTTTVADSLQTTDSCTLNVADFGTKAERSEEAEKISQLSKKLIQRQSQIDNLRAHNNMLKIQVEKLESKCKMALQPQSVGHSVVAFQDGGHRQRKIHQTQSLTGKASSWFSILVRSHPLCRVFVVMYMVCLHIWVFTVIMSSTPENKVFYTHNNPILSPN